MPRESIDLRLFNQGLVSNPDAEDIPNEAQTEGSYNLDVQTRGILKGIKAPTTDSFYGEDGILFGWIHRADDNKWDLIYSDGTDLRAITDFYGSQSASVIQSSLAAKIIIPNNQEVHIGCGKDVASKWVGYISHGQFSGSAPSGLQIEDAQPDQPSGTQTISGVSGNTTVTEEDALFPLGTMYEYKMSFIYDGYQESPLGGVAQTIQIDDYMDYITISISIASASSLNPRITGAKIYRREKPFFDSAIWTDYSAFLDYLASLKERGVFLADQFETGGIDNSARISAGTLGVYGQYSLIKDIDINDSSWAGTTTKTFSFNDENKPGSSFYNNVGIDIREEYTITYYGVDYGIAATSNNMLFVSEATHPRLPDSDASHTIFRSKPYRYDTFDWVEDRLTMPTSPTAMSSHRGKLYVWNENTTFVINPIAFSIEKAIDGRGCSSQQSLVETDYGLFWANKNGVYWSEVTTNLLKPVQDNLTESIQEQYQTAVASEIPKLVYNSARNQLLVHVGDDVFAYNIIERRWDYYEQYTISVSETVTGAFVGKDGETYTVTDGGLTTDFNQTSTKSWVFISKEFNLDSPSQLKKFYKLTADSSGSVVLEYSIDGGTTWRSPTSDKIIDASGDFEHKESIMVKASGDVNSTVDSISILYRRMRGKR